MLWKYCRKEMTDMVNVGGVWMEKFPEGWKERTEKRISEILDRYFATHEDEFWKLVEKGVLTLVPYDDDDDE